MSRDGRLTTVAGGGTDTGDPVAATQARLRPYGVALALDGESLYLTDGSDQSFYRVRRVDFASGLMTTVAGTGAPCTQFEAGWQCGDLGPAVDARIKDPTAVAVGRDGKLYIAESGRRIRVVTPDGMITTIAGDGNDTDAHDKPAREARFVTSDLDLAVGPQGSLYVTGGGGKVKEIRADGRIYTVAGSGVPGDEGDGEPATAAQMWAPAGVAVEADGTLHIVDRVFHRTRRVGPEGVITALAGKRVPLNSGGGYAGDGGLAAAAAFRDPTRVTVGPDGSLYIVDTGNDRVRRVTSPLPGFAALGDIVIAARDGRELYVFDSRGKQRRTVDAFTAAVLYEFAYDAEGRLSAVTDAGGKTTTIARPFAHRIEITGPYGQTTAVRLDDQGYLHTLENPNGERSRYHFDAGGLLTAISSPNGDTTTFSYDAKGRLTGRLYPPGVGGDELERTDVAVAGGSGYEVTHTSGEGVETRYRVEKRSSGAELRATLYPDGTASTLAIGVDGRRTETARTGTVEVSVPAPDGRFGMQAPVEQTTITTPVDALTASVTQSRVAALGDPLDPLSLTSHTETITVNGRAITRHYDPATRTYTDTSPAGRIERTVVDEDGRPVEQQSGDLEPVAFAYDADGRLAAMTRGAAPSARTSTLAYDGDGNVASATDAAGRTVAFAYDAAGRVTAQTLPGGAEIRLSYDPNGNLTTVTPPARPEHRFFYDPANRPVRYQPPDATPPLAERRTFYDYNLTGELARGG